MGAARRVHIDFDTYLTLEAEYTDVRHELVGGVMHLMTGAARRHNRLADRFMHLIFEQAESDGCRPYRADMKLRIDENSYYPDVMVVCDDPVDDLYEVAPCLVVEVLSPTTESVDRREKAAGYKSIDSMRTYVIAHPDTRNIEVHRLDGGQWSSATYGPGDSFETVCPTVHVDVDALYTGVT